MTHVCNIIWLNLSFKCVHWFLYYIVFQMPSIIIISFFEHSSKLHFSFLSLQASSFHKIHKICNWWIHCPLYPVCFQIVIINYFHLNSKRYCNILFYNYCWFSSANIVIEIIFLFQATCYLHKCCCPSQFWKGTKKPCMSRVDWWFFCCRILKAQTSHLVFNYAFLLAKTYLIWFSSFFSSSDFPNPAYAKVSLKLGQRLHAY